MRSMWRLARYLPQGMMRPLRRAVGAHWLQWGVEQVVKAIPDKVVTLSDGRRFRIGPDSIYLQIFAGRDFEPAESSVVRQLVRPGEIAVDVGANFGWYTTLLSHAVGTKGHVYAFEPVPMTFDRLQENIRLNGCTNVTATRTAVGASADVTSIHLFPALSHSRSSLARLGQERFICFESPVIDLHTFLWQHEVQQVDFLKCDVEGAELMVLQGNRSMLECSEAPMILIELNRETTAAFGYQPKDVWRFLRECGYDQYYAIDSNRAVTRVSDRTPPDQLTLLLCGKGKGIEERLSETSFTGAQHVPIRNRGSSAAEALPQTCHGERLNATASTSP